MNNLELTEIRALWERGLDVSFMKMSDDGFECLVILKDYYQAYHCHRYFMIGPSWHCSVDKREVALDEVWKWLDKNL